MNQIYDVVIAGAGHAGLLMAAWLAEAEFQVAIVDPNLEPSPASGRTLAILGGSQQLLAKTSFWKSISLLGTSINTVDVADTGAGGSVIYRAEEVGANSLACGFKQHRLRNALLAKVKSLPVKQYNGRIVAIRNAANKLEVSVDWGETVSCRLLIGADGRGSQVRKLSHITISQRSFGQHAYSFVVNHSRPHRNTVIERMCVSGPLATLPVGPNECGVTWARQPIDSEIDQSALLCELSCLLEHVLGDIELASPIDIYPLGTQHASRYVAPRLALIGDAAHGAHPIHAQGFNMGIADISTLIQELKVARHRNEDLGGACLRRYQKSCLSENQARLHMTNGLNAFFSNDLKWLFPFRRGLLSGLSAISPIRQMAIRHGMRLQT